MAAARETKPKAPPAIERFVRQLVIVHKAVSLYPPSSAIPRDTAEECAALLRVALQELPELRLVVGKKGLYFEDIAVFPDQLAFDAFAHELYLRRLADVRFHAGAEARDIIAFLSVLKYSPEEINSGGGFESRLWEQGVGTITVTEAQVTIVDAAVEEPTIAQLAENLAVPDTRKAIDEALAAAASGKRSEQLVVARLIGDPGAVRVYLEQTFRPGTGDLDLRLAGQRFSELAQLAAELDDSDDQELLASLAEAVWQLDPELQRELIIEEILPDARNSEPLSAIVRQMDVAEMCRTLAESYANGQASRDGLVRAIRNLAMISAADRDEVIATAGAAMVGAGLDQAAVGEVLEAAAPSRLTVRTAPPATTQSQPSDAIFKLIDYAPVQEPGDYDDPGVIALQDEARRGITDGDVIGSLVALVGMDSRPAQFASTMAMLEDALALLIERGEIEVAADAATSLRATADNEELLPEQRVRLIRAIDRFARPSDVRALARAARLYQPGTPEYESAMRLLSTLGPRAIEPLLEYLADETDMAARKSLVDLLSTMACDYIPELGRHVSDSRWFFVRNVVSILGSTKSSAALKYLERTLRYPDARVRRETIRGLSGINDRVAAEMLIASLSDEDAQNVQLAARYLGSTGMRGAVPALEEVARGDGRGNRDNGPRVEAIEALGRLGATEALPTLEALAGKRTIIGASKTRELRAAAESAIAVVKLKEGAR